ncbi:MAG: glycosyltransferase family 2 protein [Chloroflexaceae bacterium]|nr:glycosyltransferase family 2 protein [Chloroflexaceae bacterium]
MVHITEHFVHISSDTITLPVPMTPAGFDHSSVSLIIVNYNGAHLLPACLDSALATVPAGSEILVVDNASSDGSRAVLADYGAAVRLVPSAHNLGFGRACNLGVAAARNDMLIFLNPDVTFVPGWVSVLTDVLQQNRDIAIVGPALLRPGEPIPDYVPELITEQAAVAGCGLSTRRDTWLALGGFDESFFLYWEDAEVCWRAWLLGWRVVRSEKCYMYHEKSAITGQFGGWDAQRARNSLYTYVKLMRWPVVLAYTVRLLAVCLVKMLRWPHLSAGLLDAWVWNMRELPHTLQLRRTIQAHRIGAYDLLEQRIREHNRQMMASQRRASGRPVRRAT